MGSREQPAVGQSRAHAVVIFDAEHRAARRCTLTFSRSGAHFTAAGAELLRVPWWAIESFEPVEGEGPPPSHPAGDAPPCRVDFVTDAGSLEMQLDAATLGAIAGDLERWAPRWRLLRGHRVRRAARNAALLRGAVVSVPALLLTFVGRLLGGARASLGAVAAPLRAQAHRRVDRLLRSVSRVPIVERYVVRPVEPFVRGLLRRRVLRPAVGIASALALSASMGVTFSSVLGSHAPHPTRHVQAVSVRQPSAEDLAMAGWWGIAELVRQARYTGHTLHLARAVAPPPPAPASVADAPRLSGHEEFGFVPYWTLWQASQIDVSGFTTLSYFGVDVSPDGTLVRSGPGWDGYQSQDFANLVARAHAAGDRVVLTVKCFTEPTLTELTSSPQAATTLAAQVLQAVSAENLDGVNIDLEGTGNRAGMTALVTTVADTLHAADTHYQVTVDTYASSAVDTQGLYDVRALAQAADGLFVMAYGLNLGSAPSTASPVTSTEFSDVTTVAEYAAAVPADKVILGLAYYGYIWPTNDGTMSAVPTGTPVPISDAEALTGAHPRYWDPVTDSAWTSYEVGTQWYEAYFSDPSSIYMAGALARSHGFAGVGAWALGMEGDDPQMTAALDGSPPAQLGGPTGPTRTSMSVPEAHPHAPATIAPPVVPVSIPTTPPSSGATTTTTTAPSSKTTSTTTTTTGPPSATTTTTTSPPGTGTPVVPTDQGSGSPPTTLTTGTTRGAVAAP
jgi:hypothetical protein